VAEVIKEEIAALILHGLKDPRIGFVSVTRVEVSEDLRHAKVFVSVYGDGESTKKSIEGLENAKGFIRQRIGKRIRMRYLPEITFRVDRSIIESIRIEEIIDSIHQGNERENIPDSQPT
jgi:ribosome-binding factor A